MKPMHSYDIRSHKDKEREIKGVGVDIEMELKDEINKKNENKNDKGDYEKLKIESNISTYPNANIFTNARNTFNLSKVNSNEYNRSSKKEIRKNSIDIDMLENKNIQIYGNSLNDYNPKKLGFTKVYLYICHYPLITLGPDRKKALFTLLSMFILFVISCFLIKNLSLILQCVTIISFSIYFFSHSWTIFFNQGIPSFKYINMVNKISKNDRENYMCDPGHYKYCKLCNIHTLAKDNVSHCDECGVCSFDRNHHCPWVGKCVGKNTIVTFYGFILFYVLSIAIVVLDVFKILLNYMNKGN